MECGVQPVSSMEACDIVASTASGTPVHVGTHPVFTRVVHLSAGRRRWRPQRRKLKHFISRRRFIEGTRLRDERVAKTDFHVISEGLTVTTWIDIRRIRASFPINAQTLYRLKSNRFRSGIGQIKICRSLYSECVDASTALESHIIERALAASTMGISP